MSVFVCAIEVYIQYIYTRWFILSRIPTILGNWFSSINYKTLSIRTLSATVQSIGWFWLEIINITNFILLVTCQNHSSTIILTRPLIDVSIYFEILNAFLQRNPWTIVNCSYLVTIPTWPSRILTFSLPLSLARSRPCVCLLRRVTSVRFPSAYSSTKDEYQTKSIQQPRGTWDCLRTIGQPRSTASSCSCLHKEVLAEKMMSSRWHSRSRSVMPIQKRSLTPMSAGILRKIRNSVNVGKKEWTMGYQCSKTIICRLKGLPA